MRFLRSVREVEGEVQSFLGNAEATVTRRVSNSENVEVKETLMCQRFNSHYGLHLRLRKRHTQRHKHDRMQAHRDIKNSEICDLMKNDCDMLVLSLGH
jgi:hypothetical protein